MRRFILILAIAIVQSDGLAAQSARIRPGDQVRLHAPSPRGVFDVVEWSESSATLRDRRTGNQFELSVSSIEGMDVRLGRQTPGHGLLRGLAFGALIGGASGAVLGFASGDDPPGMFSFTAEEKAALMGGLFGVTGAVAGGVIGAAVPGSRWERVSRVTPAAVVPLPRRGVGISLSLPVG
jgi:hypothetical protein